MSYFDPYIPIGDGHKIKVNYSEEKMVHAVDLDPILNRIPDFWSGLEVNCVAGCCGVDAFDFQPTTIEDASEKVNKADLMSTLAQLRVFVENCPGDYFISRRMNNHFDRSALLELIDHIRDYAI